MAVALITGASRGIGLATAVGLARAGHTVIATMRRPDAAKELAAAVAAERLPVTPMALDVDEDCSVEAAFAQVLAEHGRIDVLVNNAGIGSPGAVEETPLDTFRRIMETNYFGALLCIKAVLPGMRTHRGGCIVNISSVAGRVSVAPQAAYAASKHALEALSECLAQEVRAFNIRVALVEPGPIATAMAGMIRRDPPKSAYPHTRRLVALFAAAMKNPTPPDVVAELVRQIVDGESWQLRCPAGPVAPRVIEWRARTRDEEWIALFGGDDAEWANTVRRELGLDLEL